MPSRNADNEFILVMTMGKDAAPPARLTIPAFHCAETPARKHPRIIIDSMVFEFATTGVPRLWKSYFEQWARSGFGAHVTILDRNRTAPRIAGLHYRDVPPYDRQQCGRETLQIEAWCREMEAGVFISTYYTAPIATPSVVMVYDMIFELLSNDRGFFDQEEKSLGILHASHLVAISDSTARDVLGLYPHLSQEDVSVVHCGVDPAFRPASDEETAAARARFGLRKPYFLLVGTRKGFHGYKNGIFLVRTLNRMKRGPEFEVVCVGGERTLGELAQFKNVAVRLLGHVSEDDLVALYSGAHALVYPSRYEGFGLPVLEAMACGCPVITCPNGSIPEVAGEAALFVADDDDAAMEAALLRVGDPTFRAQLQARGFERPPLFSWEKEADKLARILLRTAALPPKTPAEIRLWKELREKERRLEPLARLGGKMQKRLTLRLGQYRLRIGVSRS